jgi:pullulanase/glycogen debranching enzyme
MPPRLPDLIKRARRLALERDRLVQELARDWSRALKGQGFSPRDLEELWAGLTEDAVRRFARGAAGEVGAAAIRHEAHEVITRVRERVEALLAAGG